MNRRNALFYSTLLLAAVVTACAVNPVTGRRQLMLISVSEEIKLGKEADKGIVASYGVYPDRDLTLYVEEMGESMARISHRPELEFSFKILDTPVINAFAVPGGFVYVTRGILPYLGSEAELASVVGHEIGHITARHSAKQLSQVRLAQLGLGIGSALSEAFRKYSGVAEVGVGLLMLSFSRENEREADRLAIEYATTRGWAAGEMAKFFETLERMSPGGGGGLPDWFSTHPAPEKRVETVREVAEEWRGKVTFEKLTVNRDAYFDRIDGILYGPDPRQGYAYEGWFYHPEMRFRFPVPEGWTLTNETSQVQMGSPDEDAAILLTLGSHDSPEAEAEAFVSGAGITPTESGGTTINGLPAHRVTATIQSGDNEILLLSYFIQMGGQVYIFHSLSARAVYSQYEPVFEETAGGFGTLRERERIDVQPSRLRIRRVDMSTTLRRFLIASGTPGEHLEELALINGLRLDDTVETGSLVKTVEFVSPGF